MKAVKPKKNLGQHFLTDLNIAKRIADTVDACPDIPVLEIGPGMGSGTGCRPDGAARGRGRLPRSEHDHATDPRRGRRLTHCYVTPLP